MFKTSSAKTFGQKNLFALLALVLLVADRYTKSLAAKHLKDQAAIPIIDQVLELRYLENQSAAFSMDPVSLFQKIFHLSYFEQNPDAFLKAKMTFFIVMTVIVVCLLCLLFTRIPSNRHYLIMNLTLIVFITGAIGNLIDRIQYQYVIDFIYFRLIDFPIFNVADIYVTCAAISFFIFGLFYYKDEDYEMILPSRKKAD